MSKSNYNVVKSDNVPIKMWTKDVPVESAAIDQLRNIASLPFVFKHVAAMPDVHLGKGATVGSVIATKGAVIPAAVGVDIGCTDGETEYLTKTGWKKISEYCFSDEIAVYDKDSDSVYFEEPNAYIVNECEELYHLKNAVVDQKLSGDHRVILFSSRDRTISKTLLLDEWVDKNKTLKKGVSYQFKTTIPYGGGEGVDMTDDEIRLLVAISADGHIRKSGKVEFRLRKKRKIKRLMELLNNNNISSNIFNLKKEGSFACSFLFEKAEKSLDVFWNATKKQLGVLLDELQYWDGHYNKKKDSMYYYSINKNDVDLVQFAFAVHGVSSNFLGHTQKSHHHVYYRLYTTKNDFVCFPTDEKIEKVRTNDGKSYCFNTSTGYWVMRRNGKISITGNCGMNAVRTSLKASQLPDNLHSLRNKIELMVPVGFDYHNTNRLHHREHSNTKKMLNNTFRALSSRFDAIVEKHPVIMKMGKNSPDRVLLQLGTLGGGNHFIELCIDENDDVWIMLHSGSRNIGNNIGRYFIELAKKEMERFFVHLPDKDLAYFPVGTKHYDDYIEAVHWAQDYALANRKVMMELVIHALRKVLPEFTLTKEAINCHHNYVALENHYNENVLITRKGAVRAREDDLGIIPGSMGAKSYIVRGKGNHESFCSCSHGAGRKMSRSAAKKTFTLEDHELATQGVECRKDASVIDETPGAYKDIDAVMNAQKDLVDVVHTLKQVLCVKG